MCECLNKYFSIIFCPPHIFPLPAHTNTTKTYERTSKMNHTNNNTKNLSTSDSKKSNDARKRRIRENSHYNEKDQPAPGQQSVLGRCLQSSEQQRKLKEARRWILFHPRAFCYSNAMFKITEAEPNVLLPEPSCSDIFPILLSLLRFSLPVLY